MLYTIILVLHVAAAVMLIGLILVQRSDTDGFGLGGSGNSLITGRSSANLLTRATAILATVFILASLGLNIFGQQHKTPASIADQISASGEPANPSTAKPEADVPAKPVETPAVPKPAN